MLGTFQLYYARLNLISGLLLVGSGAPHGERRTDLFFKGGWKHFPDRKTSKAKVLLLLGESSFVAKNATLDLLPKMSFPVFLTFG